MTDKKSLSEQDIRTKFITPAIEQAGWDRQTQFLEEVSFTDGKIHVRGKLTARSAGKRADYILYHKPNIPVAVIEAKDNNYSVRAGIQQALEYAHMLDIPCVFRSNGEGFFFHDRTATKWDEGKKKYERSRLETALQYMREEGIVPDGWGKVVLKAESKKGKGSK